ncbi:CHAP domain-containing protein [Roseomonas elaeocarpi]|uniref:CHAP domain-containing protein n=1 Tax=Roseomonas elaeocarpi TaxID=907779 RepID=A0ABV6JYI3_9PROT
MQARYSAIAATVLCGAFVLVSSQDAEAAAQRQGNRSGHAASQHGASPVRSTPAQASRAAAKAPAARTVATTRAHGGNAKVVASARGTRAVRAAAAGSLASRGKAMVREATYSYSAGGISCVPYARMVTGMNISGNGGDWWGNAAGEYQRDGRPEPGSVLAFRASGGMRLGHVAVVERMVSAREIEIEHANWGGPGIRKGSVLHNVSVVDVSDRNDWTAVRVEVGHGSGAYGRTYSTYGFIHNRPEGSGAPRVTYASSRRYEEVAEAPALSRPLDITVRNTGR